ncbi:uncharacterized protein LOC143211139 [Lasioglossum baleicum]|uniref:uncharacterized protein LOC143211139 n=1 Tax=Lasioglossum baleicum TaxID=434251 RepID=UPI003FCE156B
MFDSLRRQLKISYYKIWKSLYISDFVTLIQPYMSIMSALGYFPYDTKLSSTDKLVKPTLIGSVIKMMIITLLCPFMIYNMKFIDKTWEEYYNTIYMVCVHTFGVVGLWAIFASSRSKVHLLRMVSTASRVLSPEEFCTTAKSMYATDIAKVCLCAIFIFGLGHDLWTVVASVVACYIFIVIMSVTTLFTNCLYVLSLCFRKINTSLEKLKTSLLTEEPHLPRRVYHSQKNPTLLLELKMLRRQHLEFSRIIDTMNECFGLEIIVIVALNIMDITANLYLFLAQNTDDGKIVNLWSLQISYVVSTSVILIALAMVSEKVKEQVKNIGSNIHRILVVTFDEQISTELELFSMQVLQQNHTITAKGLVIDVTLLTKVNYVKPVFKKRSSYTLHLQVVGIVTTYLLILIQFLFMKTC